MRSPPPAPVTPDDVCRRHVEALARSGQKVPAYARAHGLKPDTLYRWRRRFPPRVAPAPRPEPKPSSAAAPPAPRLVPVTFEAPAICELLLRDGLTLRLPTGTAPTVVASLVRALEAR
jgi:transposase-like protein